MGILFPHGFNGIYTIRKKSYFYERKREYRFRSHEYWLVASITTAFFLLQVIIGAIQTALGATRSPHLLVTIFGAIAAVIGGVLAYLQSRGQPNRTRQFRNSLRKVVEEIEFQEVQLRNPEIKTTAKDAVDYINQLYEDARFQAETNYPDFWSTAGSKATKPGSGAALMASGQPTQSNSASSHPAAGKNASAPPAANQQHTEPIPPDPEAHIPNEGGKPVQAPTPTAHIPQQGGRHANEKV